MASSFEMCCHAFDAGWAGVSYKTISFYQSREVSPRFDALPGEHPFSFCGFKIWSSCRLIPPKRISRLSVV
ncbi:MAG: hypothetical protein ACLUE2_14685 [Bacteroides cellulosilyticus]